MKKLIAFTLAFAAPAAFAIGSDEVCVYEHHFQGGPKLCQSITNNPTSAFVGGMWNDRISSLELGDAVSIELFENANFMGKRWFYESSTNSLGAANDQASSYRIHLKTAPKACLNDAYFYEGNYTCIPVSYENQTVDLVGMGLYRKAHSVVLDSGVSLTYTNEENGITRTLNENTNVLHGRFKTIAVSIPVAQQVCLFEHANYQGEKKCWTFTGNKIDVSWLGDFNDKSSSIKVSPGLTVKYYGNANFNSYLGQITSDLSFFGQANDTISSMTIE